MTHKQAIVKIKKMMREHNKATLKECERLLNSGGVSLEDKENDFILPKTVFHVALLNEASQYKPFSKEAQNDVRNLLNF